MAERFFNLEEAERLLPALEKLLRAARQSKQELEATDETLNQARNRVMQLGGSLPERTVLAQRRLEREQFVAQLQAALQQISESGVLVKDLDTGLVDFPCLLNNQEIYLCWKLGEGRIGYWHRVEDGFAGRRPIDKEFLDGIRRSRPN
jgi:hypothetical protein